MLRERVQTRHTTWPPSRRRTTHPSGRCVRTRAWCRRPRRNGRLSTSSLP